ncbi:DUF2190 family protein [Enterobacter bugandensis]|nr:DUF2190 family protein [Enterobacter bugandensis]
MKNYIQDGNTLDWVNVTAADVKSGDPVVVGESIGVAYGDIPVGKTGVLLMAGVVELPKSPTAAFEQGEKVVLSVDGITTGDDTAPLAGTAWETAQPGAVTCWVRLGY